MVVLKVWQALLQKVCVQCCDNKELSNPEAEFSQTKDFYGHLFYLVSACLHGTLFMKCKITSTL